MLKTEKSRVVSDSTITSKLGDRPPSTYSMKIQNVSQLTTSFSGSDVYTSRTFSAGKNNCIRRLVIYPKGNEKDNGAGFVSMLLMLYPKGSNTTCSTWLSLFLHLADSETKTMKTCEEIYTKCDMRILDPFGSNHETMKLDHWHKKNSTGWGSYTFLSLAKLEEAYLDKEGSLQVEMEFEVVSTTTYST